MTQAVMQILGKVEQLSEKERRELRRAIVERVPVSDDLTDADFAVLAAAAFRALEEEEIQGLATNPRPSGCRKLSGSKNDWRIRVGDVR
jgi:mRNA-degrading endonuclease RelE of RelBE toxin-antitoxin system